MDYNIYKVEIDGKLILRFEDATTESIPTDIYCQNQKWWLDKVVWKAAELTYYATYKKHEE
jgi:hypothetical protein